MKTMVCGVWLAVAALGCDDGGEDPRGGSSADGEVSTPPSDDVTGPPPDVIPGDGCGGPSESDVPRDACGAADDTMGDDSETATPSDTGQMCYADYPCFGFIGRCEEDGAVAVRMRDAGCGEVCPANGPCSGAVCVEASRERCEDGTVCVLESTSFSSGSARCRALDEVCGGPEGIACGEGSYCAYAKADYHGSGCSTMQWQGFGLCRPLADCDPAEVPGEVCGCSVAGDELVFTTYANDCARRAAGAAVAYAAPCTTP